MTDFANFYFKQKFQFPYSLYLYKLTRLYVFNLNFLITTILQFNKLIYFSQCSKRIFINTITRLQQNRNFTNFFNTRRLRILILIHAIFLLSAYDLFSQVPKECLDIYGHVFDNLGKAISAKILLNEYTYA